jgi:hypothetical protein
MDLPKDLLEEAKKICGTKTMTGTVILSLQKLIESKKIERLRSLRGTLDLNVDLKRLRKDRTAARRGSLKSRG